MAPDHQCQMTPEKSPDINEEEAPVIFMLLDSGHAETKVLAPGDTPPARVLHPKLGIGTKPRQTEWRDTIWIEYIFESSNVQMEMYKYK